MHHCGGNKSRIPLAELVISQIGGVRKTARTLGIEPTAVSRWRAPKERKGTAGDVPHRIKPLLLALVDEGKLQITPAEIIRGYREVS